MHHFESWEHGWHYFPASMCIIMLLIMVVCFFYFYKKRRIFFNSGWSRHWFADCYRSRRSDSAIDLLKKRYVRGEINKEVFEQMKEDISNTA